jgi:hypothetical protein
MGFILSGILRILAIKSVSAVSNGPSRHAQNTIVAQADTGALQCFAHNLCLRGGVKMLDATSSSMHRPASATQRPKQRSSRPAAAHRPAPKQPVAKKRKKVLRGKEAWKASSLAHMDRERGRALKLDAPAGASAAHAGGGAGGGKAWTSARRQLREEKELGAELRDLVPAMEESVSEATEARIRARGLNPGLHRLLRAYPALKDSDPNSESAAADAGGGGGGGGGGGRGGGGGGGGGGGAAGPAGGGAGGRDSDPDGASGSGAGSAGMDWADKVSESSAGSAPSSYAGF